MYTSENTTVQTFDHSTEKQTPKFQYEIWQKDQVWSGNWKNTKI